MYTRLLDTLGMKGDDEVELSAAVVKLREAAVQMMSLHQELQALQASFDALVLENMRLKNSEKASMAAGSPRDADAEKRQWALKEQELEAQVKELKGMVLSLETQIDKQDNVIQRLQDGEDAAMTRAEEALERVEAAQRDAEEAEEAEMRKVVELQAAREQLDSLERALDTQRTEMDAKNSEMDRLRHDVAAAVEVIASLTYRSHDLQSQLDSAAHDLAALEADKLAAEGQLSEMIASRGRETSGDSGLQVQVRIPVMLPDTVAELQGQASGQAEDSRLVPTAQVLEMQVDIAFDAAVAAVSLLEALARELERTVARGAGDALLEHGVDEAQRRQAARDAPAPQVPRVLLVQRSPRSPLALCAPPPPLPGEQKLECAEEGTGAEGDAQMPGAGAGADAQDTLDINIAVEMVERVEVVDRVEVTLTCQVADEDERGSSGAAERGALKVSGSDDEATYFLGMTAGNNKPTQQQAVVLADRKESDTALLVVLEQLDDSLQREAQAMQRAMELERHLQQLQDAQPPAKNDEQDGGEAVQEASGLVLTEMLESNVRNYEQKLAESNALIADMEVELLQMQAARRDACSLILEIQQELLVLREAFAAEIDASAEAEEEVEAVKDALVATADELDAVKQARMHWEASGACKMINDIQQELLAMRSDIEAEAGAAEDALREVDAVKTALLSTADELDALKDEKARNEDSSRKALETYGAKVSVLADYVERLARRDDKWMAKYNTLEMEHEALKINEAMLLQHVEATENEIKGLQTSCAALEQKLKAEQDSKLEHESAAEQVAEELREHVRRNVEALAGKTHEAEQARSAASAELVSLRDLLHTREQELAAAKQQMEALAGKTQEVQQASSAASEELATLKELLHTRDQELTAAKKQMVISDREMLATAQRLQALEAQAAEVADVRETTSVEVSVVLEQLDASLKREAEALQQVNQHKTEMSSLHCQLSAGKHDKLACEGR